MVAPQPTSSTDESLHMLTLDTSSSVARMLLKSALAADVCCLDELASLWAVDPSTVSRWQHHDRWVTVERVASLVAHLGTSGLLRAAARAEGVALPDAAPSAGDPLTHITRAARSASETAHLRVLSAMPDSDGGTEATDRELAEQIATLDDVLANATAARDALAREQGRRVRAVGGGR
jgi:hypothetical protein